MLRLYPFRFLLPAFLLLLSFFALDCRTTPTGPTDAYIAPGRRDYVWKIDTVTTDPFINITGIWGSGPDDIWAYYGGVLHFDGKSWKPQNGLYLTSIYGFSTNNVWGVNDGPKAKIMHFDGTGWREVTNFSFDDTSYIIIKEMWGESPNDIYFCGSASHPNSSYIRYIYHFDGANWSLLNIPATYYFLDQCRTNNGHLYILAERKMEDGWGYSLFELISGRFVTLISDVSDLSMEKVGAELMLSMNKKIYELNGGLSLFKDFSAYGYLGGVAGRSKKDLFGLIWPKNICHFNGEDLISIYPVPKNYTTVYSQIILQNSTILLAKDFQSGVTVSITGTLPDTTTK
jgi:hypothetical protein